MITIGYSTRKIDKNFLEMLQKTSGIPNLEVIPVENNNQFSLTEVYNDILSKSKNDIVVLCHDDIYFDSKNWGQKILNYFKKNKEYGILGVAGSTSLPKSGKWWEDFSKMKGIVNHEHEGKKWESKYSPSLGNKLDDVVLVDGLFIVVNKKNIKQNFNEDIKGFHFYDVDFSFRNFIEDVKIGVMYDIRITHKSIGQTNEEWEKNRESFSKKYEQILPVKVKLTDNNELKILLIYESIVNESSNFFKILDELPENSIKHLLCNNISKDLLRKIKSKGFLIFNEYEIPGIKKGDGSWSININGEIKNSTIDQFYNIGNVSYDFIISDSDRLINSLKIVLPKTLKILFTNNKINYHNTITNINKNSTISLKNIIFDMLNTYEIKKNKIKIVSGYTNKGGSTTALINLTNYLNDNGINCTFYGPNLWHLDKCNSDLLNNLVFDSEDIVLFHYLNLPSRPDIKKSIFVSHEKWWWSFKNINKFWDICVFLHDEHRKFHSDYTGEFTIIPNLKENLVKKDKSELDKVAGIIGSIEERKQTHVSIQRALNDGCNKIKLFGQINDENYFINFVKPLLINNVELVGYSTDKQSMYDSIGRVYHSSKGEVACLVKDECYLTNTKFFGNNETNNEVSALTNNEILNLWINLFNN